VFGRLSQEILTKNSAVSQETLIKTLLHQKQPSIKQGLPVRKTLLTAGFISVLFLTAIAEAGFVKFAQANPYMYHEWISPPAGAAPLVISISSPQNNTVYRVNDIAFTFNISTENTSIHYLLGAYFKANWMQDNVTVYKQDSYSPEFPEFWDYSETFWHMPDGEYSVVITAWGGGGYADGLTWYFFDMTTVSVVNFTVDASAHASPSPSPTPPPSPTPTPSPSPPQEPTITPESEQIEPFPAALFAAASSTSVAVVGVGLTLYFKKRKR
jgi:hypothetical protein